MPGLRRYALNKDFLGGILVAGLGLAAIAAVRDAQFGTLGRMGPGFFPSVVGCVMVAAGLAIALGGMRSAAAGADAVVPPDLRAWVMVPLSLLAFIVAGRYAGLLPATFAVVAVASFADRRNTWRSTLLLAAAMTLVCLVVFWWGLQVQFPLLTFGDGG